MAGRHPKRHSSGHVLSQLRRKARLFILERQGGTLRRVNPITGTIATFAGTGARGYGGDGGPANQAVHDGPKELAMMPSGDVLVVDTENHAILLVERDGKRIHTIAGNGSPGWETRLPPRRPAWLGRMERRLAQTERPT